MAAPAKGPRVRVAALILLDGMVVLARHRVADTSYHLLPGGGVGYRETLADALKREVLEETGLTVAVGDLLLVNDTIDPSGPRHVVNITFECTATGGEVTDLPDDPRVEAVDLVPIEELAGLDLRPPIAAELMCSLSGNTDQQRYLGSLFTPGRNGR